MEATNLWPAASSNFDRGTGLWSEKPECLFANQLKEISPKFGQLGSKKGGVTSWANTEPNVDISLMNRPKCLTTLCSA